MPFKSVQWAPMVTSSSTIIVPYELSSLVTFGTPIGRLWLDATTVSPTAAPELFLNINFPSPTVSIVQNPFILTLSPRNIFSGPLIVAGVLINESFPIAPYLYLNGDRYCRHNIYLIHIFTNGFIYISNPIIY